MTLPKAFLERPVAHRALHDHGAGIIENSPGAVQGAIDAGYGLEIDLQLSRDGVPIVFHDYDLGRLTDEPGPVALRTAEELAKIRLSGSADTIPTLAEILGLVRGNVPLLIELKDQDGGMGPNIGRLETATAAALRDYDGPVAVMSFNPHSVARMAEIASHVPRGLTTDAFGAEDWPTLKTDRRAELAGIGDIERVGAAFISHNHRHLGMPRVAEIKAQALPILCWTIRSPEEEVAARRVADAITFEHYRP